MDAGIWDASLGDLRFNDQMILARCACPLLRAQGGAFLNVSSVDLPKSECFITLKVCNNGQLVPSA